MNLNDSQNFIIDVAVNLVSDLIAWLIIVLIGLAFIIRYIFRVHSRLRKLLGLVGENNTTEVVISSFPPNAEGTVTRYGQIHMLKRPTISILELELAYSVRDAFESRRLQKLPETAKGFLNQFWAFRPIEIMITPSSLSEEAIVLSESTIIIGGPYFNSFSKHLQEQKLSDNFVEMYDVGPDVTEFRRVGTKEVVATTTKDVDIGLIQKVRLPAGSKKLVAILLAGGRTTGTKAAVYYFTTKWQEILKQYKTDDFIICLQCTRLSNNPNSYQQPTSIIHVQK